MDFVQENGPERIDLKEGALKAAVDCSVEELSQERHELLLRLLLLRSEREHHAQ